MSDDETKSRVYRKVLRLVQELHVRGYQRLRIAPHMAATGLDWRCPITPVSNILRSDGAWLARDDDGSLVARYTTGQERDYFGWTDARHADPSHLAELFLKRFPRIAEAGRGSDWLYAGWYVEMLGVTYPNHFPLAISDDSRLKDHMTTTTVAGGAEPRRIPLPPPGEADAVQP